MNGPQNYYPKMAVASASPSPSTATATGTDRTGRSWKKSLSNLSEKNAIHCVSPSTLLIETTSDHGKRGREEDGNSSRVTANPWDATTMAPSQSATATSVTHSVGTASDLTDRTVVKRTRDNRYVRRSVPAKPSFTSVMGTLVSPPPPPSPRITSTMPSTTSLVSVQSMSASTDTGSAGISGGCCSSVGGGAGGASTNTSTSMHHNYHSNGGSGINSSSSIGTTGSGTVNRNQHPINSDNNCNNKFPIVPLRRQLSGSRVEAFLSSATDHGTLLNHATSNSMMDVDTVELRPRSMSF